MSEKNYSVAAEINTEKNKLFVSFAGTPTFRYVNIDGKVEIEFNEDRITSSAS
jgi:general stress protein 26